MIVGGIGEVRETFPVYIVRTNRFTLTDQQVYIDSGKQLKHFEWIIALQIYQVWSHIQWQIVICMSQCMSGSGLSTISPPDNQVIAQPQMKIQT